jgi:hypothetical protein
VGENRPPSGVDERRKCPAQPLIIVHHVGKYREKGPPVKPAPNTPMNFRTGTTIRVRGICRPLREKAGMSRSGSGTQVRPIVPAGRARAKIQCRPPNRVAVAAVRHGWELIESRARIGQPRQSHIATMDIIFCGLKVPDLGRWRPPVIVPSVKISNWSLC